MGEAKRRAESQLISVLIPERGRPEMLERLICSLIDTAGSDERYQILVSIDTDDPAWEDREPNMHSRTRYLRRERAITLGEKLNEMARLASGEILWFIANDMIMDTPGWPAKFRQAVAKLPNGIGVPFVKDELHPDHASYPIITRKMMELVGWAFAPWFPYWFVDSVWDCMGILMDIRFEVDVSVSAPEGRGKTHGLVDLPFWVNVFNEFAPMRMRDSLRLAAEAHGPESQRFKQAMEKIGERQELCVRRTAHLSSPAFLDAWKDRSDSPPGPKYEEIKRHAELRVAQLRKQTPARPRIAIACPSGRSWEATTGTSIAALAAYSALNGIDVAILNVQSSDISHGRNATVELARKEGCFAIFWCDSDMKFRPSVLVDLMKRNKDIVGATYHKRVQDADGNYSILGKFAGARPDRMHDGLHEALLLPGGLMLVKMAVYDKIGWPYYSFHYRWPGADGLEAFKKMTREVFHTAPPEDALGELDGTKFGAWLRDGGYTLGEFGDQVPTFSEDLSFCRRARRHGYQIFCCLKTTSEIGHVGEMVVTCELGPDVVRLAEAAE